jgi:signal transduction histidine kinase/ActR/RegA family two-component response regulator
MAPNSALNFILLGGSLAVLSAKVQRSVFAARTAAVFCAAVALSRLSEHLTSVELNVDRWFFRFPQESLGLTPVGVMAAYSAIAFVLLSLSFVLATLPRPRWTNDAAKALAVIVSFIGLTFLLGYFYGAPLMYRGAQVPMAMNTAVAFMLCGIGLLINASVRDITERRSAKEALKQAHDELEERVKQRTAELSTALEALGAEIVERKQAEQTLEQTEAQLRQSQKLEAVGRLAGGVAHDFNNLLTVIMGYSELLLLRAGLDEATKNRIREIGKAGARAASLTKQLLAFSRKQVLQPVILDINSLIDGVWKMLERLIGEDVQVRIMLHPEVNRIFADPGQVEQVLINLVVNARDAMPQGGRISIQTDNIELDEGYAFTHLAVSAGDYVMLSVSDTGMGMDAETQKRIFEPFFTTKEMGKGTGLGLSTVYGIVKQSGGNIWTYSEVGKGTTFRVYFPRVQGKAESQLKIAEEALPLGEETILLVEDETNVRALTRENLRACGYNVLEAANGPDALDILTRHAGPVQLLLTDVVMPLMSGRELAERVQKTRPGLAVLYVSGFTDDTIVHHGVLDAGTEFLEKPFTLRTLARKVRSVLDKQSDQKQT